MNTTNDQGVDSREYEIRFKDKMLIALLKEGDLFERLIDKDESAISISHKAWQLIQTLWDERKFFKPVP